MLPKFVLDILDQLVRPLANFPTNVEGQAEFVSISKASVSKYPTPSIDFLGCGVATSTGSLAIVYANRTWQTT